MSKQVWKKVSVRGSQLQLKSTLDGGQSFRWKRAEDTPDSWIGVMANCVWMLRQTDTHLEYRILGELPYPVECPYSEVRMKVPAPTGTKSAKTNVKKKQALTPLYKDSYYEGLLRAYFRLHVDLEEQYAKWSAAHKHFKNEAGQFYAIRQLDQEPVENLFSFICSQNNNISRISTLVEKLCSTYGPKICEYNGHSYHAFPDCVALSKPEIDAELRLAKFGYRAKFIQKSAEEIVAKGHLKWFKELQELDYKSAHAQLIQLTGIGPKVADCICLMSLNHLEAIPVDTHVFQIAAQHYMPALDVKAKSVSAKVYEQIGNHFRLVYGPLAGWAQTVLFCSDLAKFRPKPAACTNIAPKRKKAC